MGIVTSACAVPAYVYDGCQLQLPFFEAFEAHTPTHMYCSDDKTASRIRVKRRALTYPYVSVNPPKLKLWMPFDIDAVVGGDDVVVSADEISDDTVVGALAWEMANLAMPNFSIVNPDNGHAHLLYGLEAPVACSDVARIAPLRYLSAIEAAYLERLKPYGADDGFGKLMVKNPFHKKWRTYFGRDAFWSLAELAEYVDIDKFTNKNNKKLQNNGLGRNVTLFNFLGPEGKWAYEAVRKYRKMSFEAWGEAVLQKALEMNGEFANPLGFSEVKAIAKSVAKWVWRHDKIAYERFIDRQSFKGKKSGEARLIKNEDKRATARIMRSQGVSVSAIAAELLVHRDTVYTWLKNNVSDEPKSDTYP